MLSSRLSSALLDTSTISRRALSVGESPPKRQRPPTQAALHSNYTIFLTQGPARLVPQLQLPRPTSTPDDDDGDPTMIPVTTPSWLGLRLHQNDSSSNRPNSNDYTRGWKGSLSPFGLVPLLGLISVHLLGPLSGCYIQGHLLPQFGFSKNRSPDRTK